MLLRDLVPCEYSIPIDTVTDDSRVKGQNILFIAIKGLTVDGHKYISKAVENGAVAIICTHKTEGISVPQIIVPDTQRTMNDILNRFYGNPLGNMKMIGVTGTDGKTTIAEVIYQILNHYQLKCGYIGTNGIRCDGYTQENDYTTPLQEDLFRALNGFHTNQCKYVSMEATGERLGTGKLDGVTFDASIFTNLTRDQLDLYETMERYGEAKAKLFESTKPDGICVANADDPYAYIFKEKANAQVMTYGINSPADVYATDINVQYDHLTFHLNGVFGEYDIESPISGLFNVYNLMSVILVLHQIGLPVDDIVEGIRLLHPIEARQTVIDCGQSFHVIVDYAHTANAVKNLVDYIRSTTDAGRIVVVVGAGGSRDINRRTDMAEYCTANVDYSYFTIEDARFEDPQMLLETMVSTVPNATNYELEVDRDMAITKALLNAQDNDTVLILGKGAERYMKTGGELVERLNDIDRATAVLQGLKH